MTHSYSVDSKNDFFFLQSLFPFFFLSVVVSPKCTNLELSECITFWVREFEAERKTGLREF